MKKAFVLILALTLMLAMSAPALAASTGETPVTFAISDTQISITVPTTMAAVVNAATGELTFAETGALENGSAFGVYVDSITAAAAPGWTLAATGGNVDDTIVATVSPDGGTAKAALLTSSPALSGLVWNMGADGTASDTLTLTFAGAIENVGPKTQALTTAAATAFTVTFTVAAGARS